ATNHPSRSILLVGVGYSLVLGLGAVALRGGMLAGPTWETPLATLNSLATPLTVAGLSLVSAHTGVRVAAGNTVHHYPWFPAWLGVPLAAAIFAWLVVRLRHASATRARTIEWRAVVFIAAPVALFVLVAALPGDLGKIDLYEEGQFLTEARLMLHGWLPWRDVVVVHGV